MILSDEKIHEILANRVKKMNDLSLLQTKLREVQMQSPLDLHPLIGHILFGVDVLLQKAIDLQEEHWHNSGL